MGQNEIKFTLVDTKKVCVSGFPELEGREGCYLGEGMAMFWGKEWRNYELFVANTHTCKIRKLSTEGGTMLVDDREIDLDLIAKKCPHGYRNAKDKVLKYGGVNRYGGFERGYVPFHGCCIRREDTLRIQTDLGEKTMRRNVCMP